MVQRCASGGAGHAWTTPGSHWPVTGAGAGAGCLGLPAGTLRWAAVAHADLAICSI
ncbi:hypothetical protein L226DRAFT_538236 [Lentinus tigrinus ALCF2SS1-7]|uniref:Uncharacterized protein n=1 Tax=Lentinus tigrinus ALCF2SS1-6 TaxID=1328759 RepID=A0A5C2RW94_9APHY|nr:hypothetical protein L227DRAFT_579812 [Lentinus tigrinus ALCF2SS1-6]RPD71373.1 hypothetical protein L226DRAFT_538236 [Lentinus tigrinus ALCF2SS1-7]